MISSDLPSPAEALSQVSEQSEGFAQAGNRTPLFGIMLYLSRLIILSGAPAWNAFRLCSNCSEASRT